MSLNEEKKNSRKWKAVQIVLWTHIPVAVAGTVAYFFDKGATLALGALASIVAVVVGYAGFNVAQKKVFRNGIPKS
jgi:hypothetical protein